MESGYIIIISDDEDEDCIYDVSSNEPPLIMETAIVAQKDSTVSSSKRDEELFVTSFRPAQVLPHARFDCPQHPFTATDDCEHPVPGNELLCEQCFCYICDKLAARCQKWQVSGLCHCNSHKKSDFWNTQRDVSLLGHLAAFKFSLSEVDGHLRQAESMLQTFKMELSAQIASAVSSSRDGVSHDYKSIHKCILDFINKADQQDGRAAAILRLIAVQELLQLVQVGGICAQMWADSNSPAANLMQRLVSSLQKQMVLDVFTSDFRRKLQAFYRTLSFPPQLKSISASMDVRPWDDILLASVLKGQNVDGVRNNRGKKDSLLEEFNIVLLRAERLLDQNRFRELNRYLRVVRTNQPGRLLVLKDYIPLFLCMEGDFDSALTSFFQTCRGPALRISAQQFYFYLRVLDTATVPKLSFGPECKLRITVDKWCPIEGAMPLPRIRLVRFALKVLKRCPASQINSNFWTHLLKFVLVTHQAPNGVPEPSQTFLQEAKNAVHSILNDKSGDLQIPPHFVSTFPDQALLLLVTGALSDMLQSLSLIIPVLCPFERCMWALHWFWENLLPTVQSRVAIVHKIYQELVNRGGKPTSRQIEAVRQVLWPPARLWDQYLQLKDFLPFLLCLEGKTHSALRAFFTDKGPAAHPTPQTFPVYLHLFRTSTVPQMSLTPKGELSGHWGTWKCIKGDCLHANTAFVCLSWCSTWMLLVQLLQDGT
ncbi:uncharacterized protein zgc:112980 isoform X2 [Corythoichthys intestinalis]|uniref:uncharacterized protein zgc:112980 isoform X2 n=1 Tax=Corythoichthys intestinalis TaxID=161448 RepID=UPI0025A5AA2D|nr:uncharacterized protein zgc:112980 isoform X2 [Corythoichthys intestinalis]